MRNAKLSIRAALAVLLALAVARESRAQGTINAGALAVGVQSGGSYNYTLTLNNLSSSTDPIQTLWFAWIPSPYDLLPSQPSNISTPTGWTGGVVGTGGSPYDGYSIEFTASSSAFEVNPGGSIQFHFTSADSPTTLSGSSPYPFPGYYQTLISYVYANAAGGVGVEPSGDSGVFLGVAQAPEPSTPGLLALGAAVLLLARRKFRAAPAPQTVDKSR